MSIFKRFWEKWKAVAHKIGNFQARLILVLFYFLILAPFALIVKLIDPMKIQKNTDHGWHARIQDSTLPAEKALRQW